LSLLQIELQTPAREVLVDITAPVQRALAERDPEFTGAVQVFVPHTTAGVTINEGADPAVARDLVQGLARFVPRDAGYSHSEANADAHIKTSLVGNQIVVPVEGGRLRLGTWQSIYLAEFDGPRARSVWLTLLGDG
jgi:secondary thiamine-phosphate synthase enzyme